MLLSEGQNYDILRSIALLFVVGLASDCQTGGSIILQVVDPVGRPVDYQLVSFKEKVSRAEYKSAFDGLTSARPIPFGEFEYILEPATQGAGLVTIRDSVLVGPVTVWKTNIATRAPVQESDHSYRPGEREVRNLRGIVRPAAQGADCNQWVKWISLYGTSQGEVPLDRDGQFVLPTLQRGRWGLIAFACGQPRGFTELIIPEEGPVGRVVIDVGANGFK